MGVCATSKLQWTRNSCRSNCASNGTCSCMSCVVHSQPNKQCSTHHQCKYHAPPAVHRHTVSQAQSHSRSAAAQPSAFRERQGQALTYFHSQQPLLLLLPPLLLPGPCRLACAPSSALSDTPCYTSVQCCTQSTCGSCPAPAAPLIPLT
jgi:hypothetical protein